MAVTHQTALRNTLADAAVDRLDTGAGTAVLEFRTSADAEVATLNLSNPAAGGATNGTAIFSTITDDTNATGGTIQKFVLKDRDGVVIISGSVTSIGGGGDIELSSLAVSASDTVTVTSLTYTAAS